MKEKVVPIPFLGREVSGWLYRTTRWVRENPWKACGIVAVCVGGSIIYEAQVTHKNRVPSPNVANHLEYQLKKSSELRKATGIDVATPAESIEGKDTLSEADLKNQLKLSRRTVTQAERLLEKTKNPEERAALEQLIESEKKLMEGINDTTMSVKTGQLVVRAPHWEIRNNERNWSILTRDQQQQKDHYWYRMERSKEDDYARNTILKK